MSDKDVDDRSRIDRNRREILKYGSATALSTAMIPSLAVAQSGATKNARVQQDNEDDIIERIVEEENYYITKSSAGGNRPTYFREWAAGENKGTVEELPPTHPDIPAEYVDKQTDRDTGDVVKKLMAAKVIMT